MGIEDSRITVQLAAVKCLHSLSRSVHQLRTTFQDNAVWKPLMKLLQAASEEVLKVASSAVCNLLLEFSPSKEVMVICHQCGKPILYNDQSIHSSPNIVKCFLTV